MILIKNSTVVDGTEKEPSKIDILIKDNRIISLGHFATRNEEVVLDGTGMITAPGFIDVNTDSDHYLSLFSDPAQQDFLLQGVTTIVGGHCGSSLAPLLKGTLESIRKWGDTNEVNVNWTSMAEFLSTLDRLKLGVNFATLVGHATIRRALIGEADRDLTIAEMDTLKHVVTKSLEEGAFGLSTGLGYNHGRSTPYAEVKALAEIVARFNGVYATHLRSEKTEIKESVDETLNIARDTKVKTLISHFRPLIGFEKEFTAARHLIETQSGDDFFYDSYPFNYSMLPIYTLLPDEAQEGSLEKMLKYFISRPTRDELLKTLPEFKADDLIIARAPGFDYLVGKTIGEFSKTREMNIKRGLLELMELTKLRAVLFYKNINQKANTESLLSKKALIASNSPSLLSGENVIENERAVSTFSRFLKLAADAGKPIEWAIEKLTPAKFLGLKDRGVIKEGAIADIVMLRDGKAVHVILNGTVAVKDGQLVNDRAGHILRRA